MLDNQIELALDDRIPWLHSYHVRVSPRARNVNLHIKPGVGLEVVIPKRFSRRSIPDLLVENRDWIRRHLNRLPVEAPPESEIWPPCSLDLLALDRTLYLQYQGGPLPESLSGRQISDNGRLAVTLQGDQLWCYGAYRNRAALISLIGNVLKELARGHCQPLLESAARQHDLRYRKLAVRGQKTVWGSYSSTGTLSLNYKLLFLPPELVNYVMLHELAHTRHLDHSREFWDFLVSMEPRAREFDKALSKAGQKVPAWLG